MSIEKKLRSESSQMGWRYLLSLIWDGSSDVSARVDEYDYKQLRHWHKKQIDHWANRWP